MKKVLLLLLIVLAYSCSSEKERVVRLIRTDGTLGGKQFEYVDSTFDVGDTVVIFGFDHVIVK